MDFKAIPLVVHPDTKEAIEAFIAKPSHAVLLLGNPGTGKRTLAKALANNLLQLGGASLGRSAYVHSIAPENGSIPIAAIRDVRAFLKLRVPNGGSGSACNRVIIIGEAQCMTREAQNALLKLLEEPPEGTVIICTATHVETMLPTVRSRLQKIRVRQPSMQEIVTYFVGQGVEKDVAERALMLHDGNIAAAAQTVLSDEQPDNHLSVVKQVLQATAFERLAMVDAMAKQKPDAAQFVAALSVVAAASMRKAAAAAEQDKVARWERVIEAVQVAEQALQRNANTKIVLTELMLSL